MKKSVKSLIAAVLIILLQFSVPLRAGAQDISNDDTYKYIKSMMEMIKTKYNGQYEEKSVVEGMLKGLFSSFDPYTTYLTNEEADDFKDYLDGKVSGIGIQLAQNYDKTIVYDVIDKSPAKVSGIIIGDIVISVNNKDVTKSTSEEISDLIRGEKGTDVKITIKRNGKIFDYTVVRDDIIVSPGTYKIENGIGYIKLNMFSTNSFDFIIEALTYMNLNNIDKIIMDLRDNPGGDVKQAVNIAAQFVKGDICTLDYKDPSMTDILYKSDLESSKYKLAVLVNGNSASASEIFTGAVQDSKAGIIIGTKTFGKAKVQSLIKLLTPEAYEKYSSKYGTDIVNSYDLGLYGEEPLDSEIQGEMKITTGRYKTPNGRMIDLQGIEPDIYVKDNSVSSPFPLININPLSKDSISRDGIVEGDIVTAKAILNLAGHTINDFSNTMDEATTTELKSFQGERSLEVTGQLDGATVDALNKVLSLAKYMDNRSYNKAVEVLNNK